MGEILSLGVTHGPFVIYPLEDLRDILCKAMPWPGAPKEMRDCQNWPVPMPNID